MTRTATVLVVEDERELADLFADWLGATYDVRTAYTAAEALDELDEDVDVVLLDRRLPERSGDDVLETVRAEGYDCQVAMVTAVDPDFDLLEMGFDAYVVKPVNREDLEALVNQLLARSLYSAEVQEYFSMAAKRASLEASMDDSELASDDRYHGLCEDIDAMRTNLDQLVSKLDETDFLAVFQDLSEDEVAGSD